MALFLKILADLAKQQKFITAGPTASWLWLAGVGHCRLSSTDGVIPRLIVPTLVPGLKNPFLHAETLVKAGLWERGLDGGYVVHDYLVWNPSRAQSEQMKLDDAERKRLGRRKDDYGQSGRTPDGIQTDALRVRADAPPAGASSPSPSECSSGSGGSGISEEIPISTEPPAWRSGPRRAEPGMRDLDYHRRNCPVNPPWAQAACDAGICLPKYFWPQLERRVGMAPDVLRPFVEAWALKAGPGDTPEKFWPWAAEQHFGTTVQAKPQTREQRVIAAAQRTHDAIAKGEL